MNESVEPVYVYVKHVASTHLHLGLSFAASGLKLLLVMVCLCFDLLDGQVCSNVLRVQVGAGC